MEIWARLNFTTPLYTKIIKKSYTMINTCHNNLEMAEDSVRFQIPHDDTIAKALKTHEGRLKVELFDSDYGVVASPIFTGYLRLNYNFKKKQTTEPISLEVLSPLTLFDVELREPIILIGKDVQEIIEALKTSLGLTNIIDTGLTGNDFVIPVFSAEEGDSVKDIIKKIFFEFGFVPHITPDGKLNKLPLFYIPTTEQGLQILDGTNIHESISLSRKEEQFDCVISSWKKTKEVKNILVFSDTQGGNETQKCKIEIEPGEYLFGAEENYLEWDSEAGEVITVTNITNKDVIGVNATVETYGKKGSIKYKNNTNSKQTITRLDIYGDAYVKENINIVKSSNGRKHKDIEIHYLNDLDDIKSLTQNVANYYRYSDFTMQLKSKVILNIGDYVKVNEIGGELLCRVVKKTIKLTELTFQYELEGVSDFIPVDIVNTTINSGTGVKPTLPSEINEIPEKPIITAIANEKQILKLNCIMPSGQNNIIAKIIWEINKNGNWQSIESYESVLSYKLGYEEAEELAIWQVRAKVKNVYSKESEYSEVQPVSADTYGTWILNPPAVTNSTSKRSVILQLSTPSGSREQYSTIQYRVQVQKQGEDNWWKPDLVSDPYADEDNYKDGEGYETVANTFIQSVPMESQEAGIKTTAYNYRIVGVSVETQAESEPTIITATATASTAMDIYDESIGVEKLAVKDLSAISGTFGDIKSDEIEKDATNYWILSKSNSSLGYGRAGEFCVGTTASVEPFDLVTNPTGYKDDDEFLHYLPSRTGSTLKGLFLKLANFIVDAIGSTITGAFRVEQKASRKALFEIDDIKQKVSGIQEQRGYDNIVIGTDYDGLYDSDVIKTIADGTNLLSITGQKKLVYNTQTHTETVTDDLSVDIVKHNTELWGLVDGVPSSGVKRKIGLKTNLSAFEATRKRITSAVVGSKIFIPENDGTALEIIDTATGVVETNESTFEASRKRITSAVVGDKVYIPEDDGLALEIIDTATGVVETIANAFTSSRMRKTCAVVGEKIYIPQYRGTGLEIVDTVTGQVTTIANAFKARRFRITCAVVGSKIYIPQYSGTGLEIVDTVTGQVTTIANAFEASLQRETSAVVGSKIYIPQHYGTALEIIDTTTGEVETIAKAFGAIRNRRTCAVVGDKIYIPQHYGTALEIIDTTTGEVETIAKAFGAGRFRSTCALVGSKIYIPQDNGTGLEVIDTNPHLVSITSDGANIRGISRSEYYNWTTDIATPTGISASEILAFVYDSGFTWALDLAGGQILKDTQVIATTAQVGFTSAIYSGGKFYANKGNIIREINASTGNARVLTLTEQAQHKLFVFGGKLYALPAKGATRITEIDLSTFTVIRSAQKDFLQLAGNPLAIANTAYIRQRGLMTEMTGLEWGLVTSRQLVEIGGGFVSREVATDGTRRLTTAGGEAIEFGSDGDLVATKAKAIKPLGNSITLPSTPTSTTKIIKIATVDSYYAGTFNIRCSGNTIEDTVKIYINGLPAQTSGVRVVYGKNNTVYSIKKIVVTSDTSAWNSNRQIYAEIVTKANAPTTTVLGVVETDRGYFTPSMSEVSSFAGTVVDSLELSYLRGDVSSYKHVFTKDVIGNVSTATKLAKARKIHGVDFDGTKDIYDTYSTEEHRIGTWIDGKPIYRICGNATGSSAIASKEVGTIPISWFNSSVKNVDTIIKLETGQSGVSLISTWRGASLTASGIRVQNVGAEGYGFNTSGILVIEYTKTTD